MSLLSQIRRTLSASEIEIEVAGPDALQEFESQSKIGTYSQRESIATALGRSEHNRIIARSDGVIVGAAAYSIAAKGLLHNGGEYQFPKDQTQIIYLADIGSVMPGAGSRLVHHIIAIADQSNMEMWLASTASAAGFYRQIGLKEIPGRYLFYHE